MDVAESVRLGVRSIRAHRLRSALTTLGIVIGVAAVITFVTLGASLKADVVGEIGGSGANNVYLLVEPDGDGPPAAAQPVFTEHDVSQLRSVDGVDAVVPQGTVPISALAHGNSTVARSQVTAAPPELLETAEFADGRPFRSGENEVVLNGAAASLFAGNVTVGDTLAVTRRSGDAANVTVVGITSGASAFDPFGGFATRPRFYLPTDPFYDTVVRSPTVGVRQRVYPQATVVSEPGETRAVRAEVEAYLDERSDARRLIPESFGLAARTNEDLVDRLGRILDRLTAFVTGIAVISLVVGAIGIANVMLVSVTERTRQIGIMKAVGADKRDVLQLFLVEAVILGLLGVLVGAPLGVLGGWLATVYAELPLALAPGWFAVAVVVGAGVGVVAGLYPAWRAATVDPIDALRYE